MGHCVPLCPGPPWAEGPVGLPQHGRPALRPARLAGWAGARRYPLIYSYCPRPGGRSTVSTRADVLCKIEQLNGLNKSDDKTLIAIFLPPALKRAIWRHLEKYFIKQERKQFAKFCAHLLAKLFSPPPGWGIVDLRGPQGLPGCHWRGAPLPSQLHRILTQRTRGPGGGTCPHSSWPLFYSTLDVTHSHTYSF